MGRDFGDLIDDIAGPATEFEHALLFDMRSRRKLPLRHLGTRQLESHAASKWRRFDQFQRLHAPAPIRLANDLVVRDLRGQPAVFADADFNCPAADVNGDSAVNAVDVVAIQRFFLILATGTANVGKYQFNPVSRSYSGIVTDQTGQNYDALVFGDVASGFVH